MKAGTVSTLVTYAVYSKPGNFIRVGTSANVVDYLDFLYLVGKAGKEWRQAPSDPATDFDGDHLLECGDISACGVLYGK